jgi:hypothetical protein
VKRDRTRGSGATFGAASSFRLSAELGQSLDGYGMRNLLWKALVRIRILLFAPRDQKKKCAKSNLLSDD